MMEPHQRALCLLVAGLSTATGNPLGAEEPPRRVLRCPLEAGRDATLWQAQARTVVLESLHLSDLAKADAPGADARPRLPLDSKVWGAFPSKAYTRYDLELKSTPARVVRAVLTVPDGPGPFPAVVCIHGHGGSKDIVYESLSIYHGFARALAESGFVTISIDVGQHHVWEQGRTLMGERLWDLIRCVDYLVTREEVDGQRIGCAGLSLGGEMAMWLAAMDTRVQATVSSGFLSTVANLRQKHCPCWDFPGFTENFDFADIYGLIAPRWLLCQIGRQERAPGGFPVEIAQAAMQEVQACYRRFTSDARASLHVHPEGHVFDLDSGIGFLKRALAK